MGVCQLFDLTLLDLSVHDMFLCWGTRAVLYWMARVPSCAGTPLLIGCPHLRRQPSYPAPAISPASDRPTPAARTSHGIAAYFGDCDRPFGLKVITDPGDHAVTRRPEGFLADTKIRCREGRCQSIRQWHLPRRPPPAAPLK
jgi:hypothetical protein